MLNTCCGVGYMHVIYRQVEHAWLDLGLLDQTQLGQLSTDLSNAAETVVVTHPPLRSPGSACSLTFLLLIYFPPRLKHKSASSSSARHSVNLEDLHTCCLTLKGNTYTHLRLRAM